MISLAGKYLLNEGKQQTTPLDQVRLPSKGTVGGTWEKMALRTDIGSRIPEGAVRVTRDEALHHQKTIIKEWPSDLEVGFIRYGGLISAVSNITTSALLVDYFKKYLRAGPRTALLTYVPAILVPGYMGFLVTDGILTENILLMKMDCPLCHHIKFAMSQFYIGVAYPALYSYVSYAGMALEGASRFHVAGLIQSIVVLFLPYLQSKQLSTVMSKLEEKEKAMQEGGFM